MKYREFIREEVTWRHKVGHFGLTNQSFWCVFMRKPVPFTRISRRSMRKTIPFTRISRRSMRKTIPFTRINDSECYRICSDAASLIIVSMSDEGREDVWRDKRNVGWWRRDIWYDEYPILIIKTADNAIRHHGMYHAYRQPATALTQPKASEWIATVTTWRIRSSVVR